jgi:CDP-glycerol glycerophosphotransferase (TagB/SpsB family)
MYGLRTKPDMTVVWNEFSREQVLRFQNMKDENIHIIGVPQFDSNFDERLFMSREEFCQLYGLDPIKKIILHCSSGKLFPTDVTIAELLASYIRENKFPFPSQLLVRPHYGYVNDDEKFETVKGKPGVVIDLFNNPSNLLRDRWDYSTDFKKRFINTLRHADVVINTSSTITLDALCYDKPVILIAFDGKEKIPYKESVERWYETLYYRKIISYGATKYAKSELELIDDITAYMKNPELNGKERARLRSDFTYKLDGQAGKRFAFIVEEVIANK